MPKSKQAIADDLAKRLPTPFDDVRFQLDISDEYVTLEYIGAPDRLLECGAIEPAMVGKSKAKERPRVDSAGNYYFRELRIDGSSLTRILKVTRYITDLIFAEALPGCPRGIRLKRLDWLDAHPGCVHVVSEKAGEMYDHNHRWEATLSAGTREALLETGFSDRFFKGKFSRSNGCKRIYDPDFEPKHASKTITALMRGYFEIRIGTLVEIDAPKPARMREPPKPAIRLVWTNPDDTPAA